MISNIWLHFIIEEDGHLAKNVFLLDYGIMALALEEKFPVFSPIFLSVLCPFQLVLLSIHLPAGDVLLSHPVSHFWWWVPLSAVALGRSIILSASPESLLAPIPVILQIQQLQESLSHFHSGNYFPSHLPAQHLPAKLTTPEVDFQSLQIQTQPLPSLVHVFACFSQDWFYQGDQTKAPLGLIWRDWPPPKGRHTLHLSWYMGEVLPTSITWALLGHLQWEPKLLESCNLKREQGELKLIIYEWQ